MPMLSSRLEMSMERLSELARTKKRLPENRYKMSYWMLVFKKQWKVYRLKFGWLFWLIYHWMILLKRVLIANYFFICAKESLFLKFLFLMKNCLIQGNCLITPGLLLVVMKMFVYRFADSFALALKKCFGRRVFCCCQEYYNEQASVVSFTVSRVESFVFVW